MSWQELMTLGKEKYSAGKFKEALLALSDSLAQASSDSVPAIEIAKIQLELGKTCRLMADYDKSRAFLNDAASVFKKEGREIDQALALNFLGLLHQSLHQYDESLEVLNQALQIAERVHNGKHEDIGEILNSLGLLYWRKGEDLKAIEYYDRAIAIFLATIGEDNDNYAETQDNIGVSLQRSGKLDEAVAHHLRSIEIREKCLGPDHPNIGYGLINLASAKAKLGDDTDFEALAKRTILIFEGGFGEDNPDTCTAINNLGTHYLVKHRYEEALEKYNKVLQLKEAIFGPDHPQLRITLHNLGIVHQRLGHQEESEMYRSRSLVLLKRNVEVETGKNIDSIITLADSLIGDGQKEEAERILTDALASFEEGHEKNDSKAARILDMLAGMHLKASRETAKEYLFRLLKIQKREFGAKHSTVAKTLRHLSNCFIAQGDRTTSQVLQMQARAIEFNLGLDNPEAQAFSEYLSKAQSSEGKGSINRRMMLKMLRMQGKDDDADAMEKQLLAERAAILGSDSLEYAEELRTMAIAEMDHEKSLHLLETSLAILEGNSAADIEDVLTNLQWMVRPCLSKRQFDKAEQVLLKTVAIEEERHGKDHWTLRGSLSQLVHVAEEQKNSASLEKYKKRLEELRKPTEQEEEEYNKQNHEKTQKRLNKAMAGLGSMFKSLTGTLSNLSALEEQEQDQ